MESRNAVRMHGVLKPLVSRIFPLAQAREAYELGLRGHLRGKIVLRVD